MDKAQTKAQELARKTDAAIKLIEEGKWLTTTTDTKGKTSKTPSEAIQRLFVGVEGRDVAKGVITRARANGE